MMTNLSSILPTTICAMHARVQNVHQCEIKTKPAKRFAVKSKHCQKKNRKFEPLATTPWVSNGRKDVQAAFTDLSEYGTWPTAETQTTASHTSTAPGEQRTLLAEKKLRGFMCSRQPRRGWGSYGRHLSDLDDQCFDTGHTPHAGVQATVGQSHPSDIH